MEKNGQRFKIVLRYDGTDYVGWQIQLEKASIQGTVQNALRQLNNGNTVNVIGAGRTDSGVHARQQIAHFFWSKQMDEKRLLNALNGLLPADIRVISCTRTDRNFHARYSAQMRIYQYRIHTIPDPAVNRYSYFFGTKVDERILGSCARIITGHHDFSFFSKSKSQKDDNHCVVYYAEWYFYNDGMLFEIGANRFVHSMIRLLVGTMLDVGRGRFTFDDFSKMLNRNKDINFSPVKAPARGLTLHHVLYNEEECYEAVH